MRPEVETKFVAPRFALVLGCGERMQLRVHPGRELFEVLLDFAVAGRDQLLVVAISHERLAQGKQMFVPVVADQRPGYRVFGGLDAPVTQLRQELRVSLSRQDRFHDSHAG